jgi:glycosyltransferase involved in cell wall biosynthesis
MKIVIDLQACQTPGSAQRGIGRYSMELARAIARNRGPHDVRFLLNAAFDDGIDALQDELRQMDGATVECYRLLPIATAWGDERRRLQRINDAILDWRYACTGADALHVSSVFEGWQAGGAHVSMGTGEVPAGVRSATLYDLIPLLFADIYLPPAARALYDERVALFKKLDTVFAISESARQDAIRNLGIDAHRIVNIGAAASPAFRHLGTIDPKTAEETLARCGLGRRFVLYTGGIDYRKNIEGLLAAYAALPPDVSRDVQLAVVCDLSAKERAYLLAQAAAVGVANPPVFTGYVSDDDLNFLYNACELFVFPSLYEGFGLPLLEAMTCGACVIASNASSMPEIVGDREVLFDPRDIGAMTRLMLALLQNPYRRRRLGVANRQRAGRFSWDGVARRAIEAWDEALARRRVDSAMLDGESRPRAALVAPLSTRTGAIADYSARMAPYWARPFALDWISPHPVAGAPEVAGVLAMREAAAFRQAADQYACVLYHVGTAEFPDGTRELMLDVPGILFVHDSKAAGSARAHASPFADGAAVIGDLRPQFDAAARGELEVDGIAYCGPALCEVVGLARGVVFHSQRSADLLRAAYPEIASVPWLVVPPPSPLALSDPGWPGVAAAALPDADIAWLDEVQRRPARIAEFDAGAAAYLTTVDRGRSADVLLRKVAAMLAVEGPEARLAPVANAAIAEGIAMHLASGRWMAGAR